MSIFELSSALVLALIILLTTAIGFYYIRRTRLLSQSLTELHQLNQEVDHDTLLFFRRAWSVLHRIGVYQVVAKIYWFGEEKTIQLGSVPTKKSLQIFKQIHHGDMSLDIVLQLSRQTARNGSLANLVLETFFSILERDVILKEDQVSSTQKRLERYQLFVQHEIKNIAQFIDLLSSQVAKIDKDEDKIRLAERLKKTLPVMADRAQKTIQSMKNPSFSHDEIMAFSLKEAVQEVVQMYSLNCKVLGEAEVILNRDLLIEVLKNVLGNFRDHNVDSELTIYLSANPQPNKVEIQIHSRKIPGVVLQPERMFEPFWTTSESGLGLGLFLARELLKKIDGEIHFQQSSQHFGFNLLMPKASE